MGWLAFLRQCWWWKSWWWLTNLCEHNNLMKREKETGWVSKQARYLRRFTKSPKKNSKIEAVLHFSSLWLGYTKVMFKFLVSLLVCYSVCIHHQNALFFLCTTGISDVAFLLLLFPLKWFLMIMTGFCEWLGYFCLQSSSDVHV